MANTDLISSLKTFFLKISFEKYPKVTLWVENRFLSMSMIISEKFHIDPESLKPWVERGQKVNSTVNNAKHGSSQNLDFLKRKFFSNFWTLRFRNGCFRLVELDLFEFVILSVWETIVEQIRFT